MKKTTAPVDANLYRVLTLQECSDLHDKVTVPAWQKADSSSVEVEHKGETFLIFRPEDSDYAQFIRTNMGGKFGPKGGIAVRIGYFCTSVERKNIYAKAYVKGLRKAGIDVSTFTYTLEAK